MNRNKLFNIFKDVQYLKTVARYIIHYLKKYNLDVSDHVRGEFQSFIYLMRDTEWNNLLIKYKDKEIIPPHTNFLYIVEVDFSWKGVKLSLDDLPWFLKYNRYIINKNSKDLWYYENFKYYFRDRNDYSKFLIHAITFKYIKP